MKNYLISTFRFLLHVFPKRLLIILVEQLFVVLKISPLRYAYQRMGINEVNADIGEKMFVHQLLWGMLGEKKRDVVLFDVGANRGNFTALLHERFPDASIYSFEPLPEAYKLFSKRFAKNNYIVAENFGFSDGIGKLPIYTYEHDPKSEHATLYLGVLEKAHQSHANCSTEIELNTIDNYCSKHNIDHIDFLKIDTEGHELKILKGAKRLLTSGQINVIQFEFNEMNIFSKVFLKDYYELLPDYDFFRISSSGLIALGDYSTDFEIFKFQNLVAVKKKVNQTGFEFEVRPGK